MSDKVLLPLFAMLSHSVNAEIWTVDCSVLTTQRIDPIVMHGQNVAGHVHAVAGGSKFGPSLTYNDTQQGKCTSCNAGIDHTNYWVPQMYIYKQSDGKYHYVPMEFHIYYKLVNDRGQTDPINNPIKEGDFSAFPPDYRVRVGSPDATEADTVYKIMHQCLGPGSLTRGFPTNPEECWGIRGEATFPSCWDGVNLDSESHGPNPFNYSHVSYPVGGNWAAGPCPETHPVRLPTVYFEAIFKTGDLFEAGDALVYSFDDWVGYGFHGDFFNGWEEGAIEGLIEACTNHSWLWNCGLDKSSPWECEWEGVEDDSIYTGIYDELPPHTPRRELASGASFPSLRWLLVALALVCTNGIL